MTHLEKFSLVKFAEQKVPKQLAKGVHVAARSVEKGTAGAATGAGLGAVVPMLLGKGNPFAGARIGSVAGAVAGGAYGAYAANKNFNRRNQGRVQRMLAMIQKKFRA